MIPIIKPNVGEEEAEAAARVVRSGWLSQGAEVARFEEEFAQFVGARYACAVSNCTTALHLALLASDVGPGDEVITVSHSFVATANAIKYCGAEPVFVDIEKETFNIDPEKVEAAITPKTKAILVVHQMGMPCDLEVIAFIAQQFGLTLIEDAACAIGSEILIRDQWQKIGHPYGDIACFSMHPRKILTTGEGGMLTTHSAACDAKFRLLRQHAMTVPDTVRHATDQVIFEEYEEVGYNYRMTDIQAAIGRVQLRKMPAMVARRRALAQLYQEHLSEIDGVVVPTEPEWARSNWQSYCVRLPGRNQREIMQALLDKGISSRRGIMCAHRERPYRGMYSLPLSEEAQDEAIILPLYHGLQDDEIGYIISTLRGILCR